MQSIGERLQEARQQRGVTLQAAANETKIREEYLQMLEETNGKDIPLDAIYVRGFIRNYAKYLRMDSSKLLADWDAMESSVHNAATPKSQKELIGRLELGAEAPPTPTLTKDDTPTVTDRAAPPSVDASPAIRLKLPAMPAWAWPVAAGFVGVIVLWGITVSILGASQKSSKAPSPAAQVAPTGTLRLRASGDVTVIVKQADSGATLFAGSLRKGEEKLITRQGSVRVQYSDGNLLEVEQNGKRYKMGAAGAGRRVVD